MFLFACYTYFPAFFPFPPPPFFFCLSKMFHVLERYPYKFWLARLSTQMALQKKSVSFFWDLRYLRVWRRGENLYVPPPPPPPPPTTIGFCVPACDDFRRMRGKWRNGLVKLLWLMWKNTNFHLISVHCHSFPLWIRKLILSAVVGIFTLQYLAKIWSPIGGNGTNSMESTKNRPFKIRDVCWCDMVTFNFE